MRTGRWENGTTRGQEDGRTEGQEDGRLRLCTLPFRMLCSLGVYFSFVGYKKKLVSLYLPMTHNYSVNYTLLN